MIVTTSFLKALRKLCAPTRLPAIALLLLVAAGSGAQDRGMHEGSPDAFSESDLEFFERQVRPILATRCYECHSREVKEPKGGLRLDSRAAVLGGGDTGPALVPGDAQGSLLIDAVNYGEIYQMPPKTKLPDAEIAVLVKWVELGAPWPAEPQVAVAEPDQFDLQDRRAKHWCWQPLAPPEPPQVQQAGWPRQDLDRFLLAELEARGLQPAPPAGKQTLMRRAQFDLIGLPPTPEEVEAFVGDDSPQAFERLVDRLLESPHFGERWARHWLDLVRYAETFGHEFDYPIHHAHEYRDYVIRAFNADLPYDQLIAEHIAGDLLDRPRLHPDEAYNESVIGTGFWWLGEATHAPVDVKGDEAGRIDNQIDVLTKTFLGLTVACARCHDHKFDAISTGDYYALSGVLQSSRRQEALLDPGGRIRAVGEQLQAIHREAAPLVADAVAPGLSVDAASLARYLLAARPAAASASADVVAPADLEGLDPELVRRWAASLACDQVRQQDHPLYAWVATAAQADVAQALDTLRGQLARETEQARQHNTRLPVLADFAGDSDWFVAGHAFTSPAAHGGRWDPRGDGVKLVPPGIAHSGLLADRLQGVLRSPTFTLTHKNLYYRIAGSGAKVRLVLDGYFMDEFSALLFRGFAFDVETDGHFVWHRQAEDVERYVGQRAYIEIIDHGDGYVAIDEIRLSDGEAPQVVPSRLAQQALGAADVDSLEELATEYGRICAEAVRAWRDGAADAEQVALVRWLLECELLPVSAEAAAELERLKQRRQELSAALPAPRRVLAMTDGSGEDEHVFVRGNHRLPGDLVPRGFLTALVDRPQPIVEGSGRLQLAARIASAENPLTARVMVNRIWHHLFGRGIVASTDNFGVLGQPPTHPQLLDHLAAQFIEEGWSIKRLIRTIMLSSAYQMSSAPDPAAAAADPQNRWLHRMRVRRLQGEAIRDAILALSGRLDQTKFGPSVSVHITPFMQGRGRPKQSGPLDGQGRRSIYVEVRRNFLPPMMLAFDTPIPFNTVGRRNVSNVPAQALILMNDPFVLEQAALWARRVLRDQRDPEARIRDMYLSAFAREPSPVEMADALEFLRRQSQQLGITPEAGENDERVWADFAHVLLNVKEFVFVN